MILGAKVTICLDCRLFSFNIHLMSRRTKQTIISLIISLVVSVISFTVVLVLSGLNRAGFIHVSYSDAFFAAAVVNIFAIAFVFVTRTGLFDGFMFTMGSWIHLIFRHESPRKYEKFQQYKDAKESKRSMDKIVYWPYLAIGALCLALAFVFMGIAFNSGYYGSI